MTFHIVGHYFEILLYFWPGAFQLFNASVNGRKSRTPLYYGDLRKLIYLREWCNDVQHVPKETDNILLIFAETEVTLLVD
jgi:hypothetical protein